MTQILVTKPGALTAADRKILRRSGVVCIEADHPSEVRLIGAEGPPMDGNDLAFAALKALADEPGGNYVSSARDRFARIMSDILSDRRAEASADA